MGILLSFPATSLTRPRFRNLSQTIADFVHQLKSIQELAEESFQKLAEVPLSVALDGLETALADIDAIGHLLPPGEFKTQFDLDRSSLYKQLDLVKSKVVDLRGTNGSRRTRSPLEATEAEPQSTEQDLIVKLQEMVERGIKAMSAAPVAVAATQGTLVPQVIEHEHQLREVTADDLERAMSEADIEIVSPSATEDTAMPQVLERELRPGEVSLDELESALRETAVEIASPPPPEIAPPSAPKG